MTHFINWKAIIDTPSGEKENKGEQLEVEIVKIKPLSDTSFLVVMKDFKRSVMAKFFSKTKAIDFCNRFNLKIKGEA